MTSTYRDIITRHKVGITYFAIVATIVAALAFVHKFGVNVPVSDEFENIRLLMELESNTLSPYHIYHHHNEHRIVFAKLIFLTTNYVTSDYNTRDFMFYSQILLFCALLFYLGAFKRHFDFSRDCLYFIPVVLLLYLFNQYENFLWGFQVAFVMVSVSAVATTYYVSRYAETRERIYLAAALLCAIICSFSSVMGLLVWISSAALLLYAWLGERKKSFAIGLAVWTSFAVLTWLLYFRDYIRPPNHPQLTVVLEKPLIFIGYFLGSLGTSLTAYLPLRIAFGTLVCVLFVYALYVSLRYRIRNNLFWLGVGAFFLLTLLSISVGRCGFGIRQGGVSRYVSFSLPVIIAVYVALFGACRQLKDRWHTHLFAFFCVLVVAGITWSNARGYKNGRDDFKLKTEYVNIARDFEHVPDKELLKLYPDHRKAFQRLEFMKSKNYGMFRQTHK